MIEGVIDKINTNKYFVGFMMIILTIGGRFIISELSEEQKNKIDTPVFRKIFIFCAFFMATRDLMITILLTVGFMLFLESINFEGETFENDDDYEEYQLSNDKLGIFINY
tara:strand:- start:3301 stop:3630 length:330 start_codon:yes stop_codon:yes gene_type:complete